MSSYKNNDLRSQILWHLILQKIMADGMAVSEKSQTLFAMTLKNCHHY